MSSAQWADQQRDRELIVTFRRFILGSLIVHAVAIAAALIVAQFNFHPHYDDSAMIVNFRGRPGQRARGEAGPRPPAPEPKAVIPPAPQPKPEAKPEAKPEPKPEPKVEPKPEPKSATREVSPDKIKVDPKKPDPKKPDPKAEIKPPITPPKPDPKKPPTPDLDAPMPPGNEDIALARLMMQGRGRGGAGNGTGGGGDWDGVEGYEGDGALGLYQSDEFWLAIEDLLHLPIDAVLSPTDAIQIVIQVDNNGKVLDAVIYKESNNPNVNRVVKKGLEGVKAKKDLPPPPKPSKEGYYFLKYTITPEMGN
jgi:hypothetical protein